MSDEMNRLKSRIILKQEIKSNQYPEVMGMATLIFDKVFGGLDGATFGSFDAFSVGAGEDV